MNDQRTCLLWMQIEFPSGSKTMAIRQTGVSNGSRVNFMLFARSLATAESKSSTSKAIAGPSFEGFQSSDDILLIAKVDGPRSYSIQRRSPLSKVRVDSSFRTSS